MTTEWVITAAAERVELDAHNRGETTFTVTNPASAPDRVVFEAVAGGGADGTWFTVEEPQRLVTGGGSVSYLVRIAVPAGAAPGSYSLQGRAYSADTAPEESSRLSGRVALEARPTVRPARPWWPYAVAAGLAVVVLGTVGWLLLRPGDAPPPAPPPPPAAPCLPGFVVREAVPGDGVCVTPETRAEVLADNALADQRRSPTGGAYGPDTCLQGFVWREAVPGDVVCVPPETRSRTFADNAQADARRAPAGG